MKFVKTAACAALLSVSAPALASADEFSAAEKAEIGATIREYLIQNPEVIVEAMTELERRRQESERTADQDKIAANHEAIFNDGFSRIGGNPDGDVTVVEFFDYRCGYCKKAHESVNALLGADTNIRFVYKEFPILGPESTLASRAALASRKQGEELYAEYSDAMMEHHGALDEPTIFAIAKASGVDTDQLREDMSAPEIAENIRTTYALARELGINGTPGFIIGNEITRGYVPYDQLKEMVERARKQG